MCPLNKYLGLLSFTYVMSLKLENTPSQSDAKKLVHAFIIHKLDCCNLLLSGFSKCSLKSLKLIQNASTEVLTGMRTRADISHILASLAPY